MSKILFIDVDGTLVDYDNNIPQSAVEAIIMGIKYIYVLVVVNLKYIKNYGI